jgi:hypothetical protein
MTTSILWSVSFRAICQQGLVQGRARGVLVASKIPPKIHVPATPFQSAVVSSPFGSVIATVPSLRWRKLARAIERTRTPIALARAIFVRGHRTICKLVPVYPKASGCLSFLRALVHDANQSASCVTKSLKVSKVLSCVSTSHAHKKAWRRSHVAHEKSVKGA